MLETSTIHKDEDMIYRGKIKTLLKESIVNQGSIDLENSMDSNSIGSDEDISMKKVSSFELSDGSGGFIENLILQIIYTLQKIEIDSNGTKLLEDADIVVLGTLPASKVVRICGFKPPEYLWFVLSGGGCDIIQLVIDYFVYKLLNVNDATTCWTVSFVLSILIRHSSHRYLVFGNYVGGYYKSLIRMYGGYSFSIIASLIFNWTLTHSFLLSHYITWVVTMLWTGIVNYFILKRLWSFTGS